MTAVGTSVARKDGIGKATGAAQYADDIVFPGMLHGRTVRSTIPRGRVRSIRFDFDTTGFTIADYHDVPATNAVDLIAQDQPFLVESEVKHMAEPIILLAHEDREKLLAAKVEIEYDEQEALFDPGKSTQIFKTIDIVKGETEAALAAAAGNDLVIVEGTYRTGHQEHVYIEPNGVIAVPEEGGIAIYGSAQCPFYVIKALRCLLGREPVDKEAGAELESGEDGQARHDFEVPMRTLVEPGVQRHGALELTEAADPFTEHHQRFSEPSFPRMSRVLTGCDHQLVGRSPRGCGS